MSNVTAHPFKIAVLFIVAVGAIAFCAFPFTKSGRSAPRWVGRAFVVAGVCILAWSTFGLLLLAQATAFSAAVQQWLYEAKTRLGALGVGVLVTLLISGQLFKRSGPPKESEAASP